MMAVHDAPKRYHRISPVRRWRITVAVVWAWTIAMVAIAIILAVSISSDAVGQPRTVAARPEQKRIAATTLSVPAPKRVEPDGPRRTSLGVFTVTAYCPCARCCGVWASRRPEGIVYTASGTVATEGRTVAVDPDIIPYGTVLYIGGHRYIAEDCGGAIRGARIDIYYSSHDAARAWGVQDLEVMTDTLNME